MIQTFNPLINEIKIKSANKKRIYLNGAIDEDTAIEVSYFVDKIMNMDLEEENPVKEVVFIINSYGGSVLHGNAIIGSIERLKRNGYKTIAVVESCAFSMAFDILIHCDVRKGYRYSQYMIHQTAMGIPPSELKNIEDVIVFEKKAWNVCVGYYAERTKFTKKELDKIYNEKKDMYLLASEALEKGVIDEVL